MDSRRHAQPPHDHAPDPLEPHWLSASLPDGLYVLPPDPGAQADGQGQRAAEALLAASIAIATGLLVLTMTIAAALA